MALSSIWCGFEFGGAVCICTMYVYEADYTVSNITSIL